MLSKSLWFQFINSCFLLGSNCLVNHKNYDAYDLNPSILSVDGIHTLLNVIIVDLIWANLLSWMAFSYWVTMIMTTQVKEEFYCDYYLIHIFLPLGIEVFGCLHNSLITFFINVLTWRGQQKASKALLYQCYIPFINKKCLWLYKECRPPPS